MSERPADIIDQAEEVTVRLRDASLATIASQVKPQQFQRHDGTWPEPDCVECGDKLPAVRLQMGRVLCVRCQEVLEHKQAQFYRR